MSSYKPPVRVSVDDPVCTATSLEGTVIGVLFEKKGTEIKQALTSRIKVIEETVNAYKEVITNIEDFNTRKRKVLKDLDIYYQNRCDEKEALIKPYHRKIEEILKDCNDSVFGFNRDTNKALGEKAVIFEEGFDDIQSNFIALDEFMEREKEIIGGIQGVPGLPGYQGITGIQGATGMHGIKSMMDHSAGSIATAYIKNAIPLEGEVSSEEDKALAKMHTLRDLLAKYVRKVDSLKQIQWKLKEERRRLLLIYNNIVDDRLYKLDLNKLSAFGFEDIV